MVSSKFCLDTHPLIWYFTGQTTLSNNTRKILDSIFAGKSVCFIPSLVLLEAFHVSLKVEKFRFDLFLKQIRLSNIIIVPLDKIVLTTCWKLPSKLDIHDRVIVATALVNRCPLVTKDVDLGKLPSVKTLW